MRSRRAAPQGTVPKRLAFAVSETRAAIAILFLPIPGGSDPAAR